MDRWLKEIGDVPNQPEKELIAKLWNGSKTQPVTVEPQISILNGEVSISSHTDGASIGYKIVGSDGKTPKFWSIYQKPFEIRGNDKVISQTYRIGFIPSKVVEK